MHSTEGGHSKFSIPVTTPSGIEVRIPYINNRQYLDIIKFCANADFIGLENIFEEYIFKKIPKVLNCIDKFYILLAARAFFVDENIIIQAKDKEINFSLFNILRNLDELELASQTYTSGNITFELDIPGKLYYDNLDDYIDNIIKTISIKGKGTIDFTQATREEKVTIIDNLPNDTINILFNHIKAITKTFSDFTLIQENKVFEVESVHFDLVSSNLISFIASIYSLNLKSFFEMLFVFTNKLLGDSNLFFSLTPIDTRVMLNILTAQIERENSSLKNSNRV